MAVFTVYFRQSSFDRPAVGSHSIPLQGLVPPIYGAHIGNKGFGGRPESLRLSNNVVNSLVFSKNRPTKTHTLTQSLVAVVSLPRPFRLVAVVETPTFFHTAIQYPIRDTQSVRYIKTRTDHLNECSRRELHVTCRSKLLYLDLSVHSFRAQSFPYCFG